MLELQRRNFDLNLQRTEAECLHENQRKKPTIELLLFEDAWADGDNHDQARDNQGHRNKRYQEDAASAGGEFASNNPVLKS